MTTTSTPCTVRWRRGTAIVAATALALVAAACGADPDDSSSAGTTAPAGAGPAGLKTIDPAPLQALVDGMGRDALVPGVMVLLRTPQGEVVATAGTTELGAQTLPDPGTHFRIASITKTMTAAVIVQLAQEGELSLDDPVSTYVPGVPDGENITLAQLLEMRSGLYSFTDAPELSDALDQDPARTWTPQELLAMAFARPAMFAPGAEYYYSNTNYVLLGLIAEQLDGKPLATIFQDRLFGPLGMTNTFLPPADSVALPEPYSRGYLYGGSSHVLLGEPSYTPEEAAEAEAGTLQPTDHTGINHSFAYAAGGVVSTAADLATWIKALSGGEVFGAEYQQIWQDSAKIIDPSNSYNWYGYGIDQLRWGPNTIDLHGGQTPGYNSEAAHDPASDMTLVVWANLTMTLDNHFTAADLMVKVFDQIYALSPLAGTATTTS